MIRLIAMACGRYYECMESQSEREIVEISEEFLCGVDVSQWLLVNIGSRQGSVMSLWLWMVRCERCMLGCLGED